MKHQLTAIDKLGNGKVLYGGVGTGKSATALGYYMKHEKFKDIVVITTAKKRDSLDWEGEAARFGIGTERDSTVAGTITIDSWQNISKYTDVRDRFFIFDEQRLVGNGVWVKSFIKIARENRWILLSATPGDTWLDYAPIFIANGHYKNVTQFKLAHVLYEPFMKYPKVRGYLNETKLEALRNEILVEMPFLKHTERVLNHIPVEHNQELFMKVWKDRWHVYEDRPIKDIAELFRVMRKVVNTDPSRLEMIYKLMECHDRLIVFYTFNYELEILRTLGKNIPVAEWNGHKKEPIPDTDKWVYLVQYVAGAEGWNCTSTNAMILYSQTYSYKNFEQAQGRIDRLDTPFTSLFYYILASNTVIDRAIENTISEKRNFNERKFMEEMENLGKIKK